LWAAPKDLQSLLEKPILVRSGLQVLARKANNGNLVERENALTKRILTVTLTERATGRDGHTGKELKRILAKDGSKLLAFLPNLVFVIAKDNNSRLYAKGMEILILFNGKDNCPRRTLLVEGSIFAKCNLFISVELLNATFFFEEAFQPKLYVGMTVGKRFEEQRRAVLMALTKEATGSKVVRVEDAGDQRKEWETCPGTRMPSTHIRNQVEGRFGKGTPQSSFRLFTCDL
jgi:hypothetical protein